MKKLLLASALVSTLASVAGAAVTTSGTDGVRWSGTTPDLGPDSFCEFKNITDGTMEYVPPGEISIYDQPGFWYTTYPAEVEIQSLYAKSIIVEGDNTLYLGETATTHGILVDYFPDNTGINANNVPNSNNDPNHYAGLGLNNYAHNTWYTKTIGTTQYDTLLELQGTVVGGNVNIPGGRNARNRFEIHEIEGGPTSYLGMHGAGNPFTTTLSIAGAAYMLDGNGEPLPSETAAGPDGNYGMVDGNYHIKHKVTCLQ